MSFEDSAPEELADRLGRFVDNLPGLAYRCEPEPPWEMSFIRGRVEALTGYPPSAFEDGDVAYGELVVEDDVDDLVATVEAAVAAGEQFTASYRIRTRQDGVTHVFERGVPVVEDGTVVALEGIIVDVTDRYEREAALREEQAFTRSILAALPDILYAFDEEGTLTRWNDRLSAVTGFTDAEIAEMSPLEFVAEQDRDRVESHVRRVLEEGVSTTVEARLLTTDGEHVPHEFTGAPMRDDDGRITGLVGVGRDVSDRKERERRFEAVFDNTYQFTGLMEPDGTLLEANTTGLSFTGWEQGDADGSKLWESPVFETADAREAMREGVEQAREGESYRTEVELHGDSREAVVDFSIRPITDDDGEVTVLVPEGRDITKLKERERLLRLLHRLLRHNLRNDLNTIRGYADILEAETTDAELAEYADRVESAADELVSMSETSREFITLALDFEESDTPVDLRELLGTIVDEVRREYPGVSIELSGDESAVIEGDTRLEYLFSELLENAVQHGAGGADDDRKPDDASPAVAVGVEDVADAVRVTVADDGPGIPDDEWTAVIEESAVENTQLRHGSGVGLLLSKWVVDRYGGSIHADGSDGGSRVTVTLPKD